MIIYVLLLTKYEAIVPRLSVAKLLCYVTTKAFTILNI